MRYATVCSGIGAPECAWTSLGWECVFQAEIEKFPSAVLKHHYPKVPNYGDITRFQEWPDHAIDLLVGGTPCQSFSVAGLRAGLADPRGNLALTFLALVERYRPQWVVWENVPGVHSSWSDAENGHATEASGEAESVVRRLALEAGIDPETIDLLGGFEECVQSSDFDSFLAGLAELGDGIASRVYDAQYFDLAQRRERVFVVGCAGGQWQRAAAVLFDGESLRGNPAPRREKGQGTAPCLAARTRGGGGLGTDAECDGAVIPIQEIGKRESGTPQNGVGHGQAGDPMFTLHALQADSGKTGKGDSAPCVAFRAAGQDGFTPDTVSPPLCESDGGGAIPSVAFHQNQRAEVTVNDTMGSLNSGGGKQGQGYPAIQQGYAVRRLTPRECERLQGFEDDYTNIPYRGKPAADGPRYKALGNSMAVPVLRYIGERIASAGCA